MISNAEASEWCENNIELSATSNSEKTFEKTNSKNLPNKTAKNQNNVNYIHDINDDKVEAWFTELHYAVYQEDLSRIKILITQDIDLNELTKEAHVARHITVKVLTLGFWNKAWNETALHIAARIGNKEIVQILLEAGINCRIKNNMGQMAADLAPRSIKNLIIKFSNNFSKENNITILSEQDGDFVRLTKTPKSNQKKNPKYKSQEVFPKKERQLKHKMLYLEDLVSIAQQQLEDMIESFKKTLETNPGNQICWYNLVYIYYYKAEYQQAIKFSNEALKINSNNIHLLNIKTLVYLMLDKKVKVKSLIKEILIPNTFSYFAKLVQSLLLYAEGLDEAAAQLFKQVEAYYQQTDNQQKITEQLELYFYGINYFIHLKKFDLAKGYIHKALALKADYLPIGNLAKELDNLLFSSWHQLNNEIKVQQDQITTLTDEVSTLQLQKDDLAKQLKDEKQSKAESLQMNEQLLTKVKDLEQKYQTIPDQNTDLIREKELLVQKINKLQMQLKEIKAEKNYDSIALLQQRLENYQAEYTKLLEAVGEIVEANEKHQVTIVKLQTKLDSQNKHIEQQAHNLKEKVLVIENYPQENKRLSELLKAKHSKKITFFGPSVASTSETDTSNIQDNASTTKNSLMQGR